MKIGVVSDTHGLLRAEVLTALEGCAHILHAGDVGNLGILDALAEIAPTTAIRGNVDDHGECRRLLAVEVAELAGRTIYILHDLKTLDLDPLGAGFAAVISGHTHKPKIEWRNGVLYFNPGSCGPKRFSSPISLGFLEITDESIEPRLLRLE